MHVMPEQLIKSPNEVCVKEVDLGLRLELLVQHLYMA